VGLGPEDSRTAPVAVPASHREDDPQRAFENGEAEARVAFVLMRSSHASYLTVKAIAAKTSVSERTVRDIAKRYLSKRLVAVKTSKYGKSESITQVKLLAAGRVQLQAEVDETKAKRPQWLRGLEGAPIIDD